MAQCSKCGAKLGMFHPADVCSACQDQAMLAGIAQREAQREAESVKTKERLAEIRERSQHVILTTTHHVEGCYVAQYLGIESVEYIIGTGIFSEISTSFADVFGQRSTGFETKLQVAKQEALQMLQFQAAKKGANAVIGMDIDYTEFSNNRVALIVNGTLVRVANHSP